MSNRATLSFSCILGTSLSVLCLIVLSAWIVRNEMRHSALESRVMSIETALDDLRKKHTHVSVSVTEELKESEKGKHFLIISGQKQRTNDVTFCPDT